MDVCVSLCVCVAILSRSQESKRIYIFTGSFLIQFPKKKDVRLRIVKSILSVDFALLSHSTFEFSKTCVFYGKCCMCERDFYRFFFLCRRFNCLVCCTTEKKAIARKMLVYVFLSQRTFFVLFLSKCFSEILSKSVKQLVLESQS